MMKKIIIILAIVVLLISMANGAIPPNDKKVKEVREENEAKLFTIEGVSGVSHDENEIIVYLEKPEISKKVPKVLDGIPVRFEVIGRIDALRAVAMQKPPTLDPTTYYSRTDPQTSMFGGISIGSPYTTAGTLGLVTKENYVLSNAHVLALDGNCEFIGIGTEILQPGIWDGGLPTDKIGELSDYIPIIFNDADADNYADAAISTLTVRGIQGEILNKQDNGFYTIDGTTDVSIGDRVRKSGRTTGVTTGKVIDTHATMKVNYGIKYATFKEQIVVWGRFSQPGDSGSAVDKDGEFVGLVFAGSSRYSIVNKAEYILEPLEITV